MTTTNTKLYVVPLNAEWNKRTCNYWYLVYAGSYNHTAFETQAGLLRWLSERGLALNGELPPHQQGGEMIRIIGTYRKQSHMSYDEFYSLPSVVVETKTLSNGAHTMARITEDEDGIRTVHTLNPNCKFRPVYDYKATSAELR